MPLIECTLTPQMFYAEPKVFMVEAQPIAEMLGEAVDTPGQAVYVNGHGVERQLWRMITPKEGTRIDVMVPIHGGGGGGKKNTLAIIATLVVAAGAIAISGGALGPAGLGIAGLGGGTLGAAAASSAFGLPDSLAVASLRPRKLRR